MKEMIYVRFYGIIPFEGSLFEDYLTFDSDTSIENISIQCVEYGLENAKKYSHLRREYGMDRQEFNLLFIDSIHWQIITEEEFMEAIS